MVAQSKRDIKHRLDLYYLGWGDAFASLKCGMNVNLRESAKHATSPCPLWSYSSVTASGVMSRSKGSHSHSLPLIVVAGWKFCLRYTQRHLLKR